MLLPTFLSSAALALTANAFLLPLQTDENGKLTNILPAVVEPGSQSVKVDCSSCPYALSSSRNGRHEWTNDVKSELKMKFTVSGKDVALNGVPFFPVKALGLPPPLYAKQTKKDSEESTMDGFDGKLQLSYSIEVESRGKFPSEDSTEELLALIVSPMGLEGEMINVDDIHVMVTHNPETNQVGPNDGVCNLNSRQLTFPSLPLSLYAQWPLHPLPQNRSAAQSCAVSSARSRPRSLPPANLPPKRPTRSNVLASIVFTSSYGSLLHLMTCLTPRKRTRPCTSQPTARCAPANSVITVVSKLSIAALSTTSLRVVNAYSSLCYSPFSLVLPSVWALVLLGCSLARLSYSSGFATVVRLLLAPLTSQLRGMKRPTCQSTKIWKLQMWRSLPSRIRSRVVYEDALLLLVLAAKILVRGVPGHVLPGQGQIRASMASRFGESLTDYLRPISCGDFL